LTTNSTVKEWILDVCSTVNERKKGRKDGYGKYVQRSVEQQRGADQDEYR
jgi:hypothetical protein